jgi:hypothetical protein
MKSASPPKGLLDHVLRVPLLVKAGTACGAVAGLTLGFMVSAQVGILGVALGATVGIVCGVVMDRDERRFNHRTRELDDIIGITKGSLGTPSRISIPPPLPTPNRDEELRSWLAEWMTPAPPRTS